MLLYISRSFFVVYKLLSCMLPTLSLILALWVLAGEFLFPLHVPRPCLPASRREICYVDLLYSEDVQSFFGTGPQGSLNDSSVVSGGPLRMSNLDLGTKPHILYSHWGLVALTNHSLSVGVAPN